MNDDYDIDDDDDDQGPLAIGCAAPPPPHLACRQTCSTSIALVDATLLIKRKRYSLSVNLVQGKPSLSANRGRPPLQQFTFDSPMVIAMMFVDDDYDDTITIMMIDHDYNNEHDYDTAYDDDSDDNDGD